MANSVSGKAKSSVLRSGVTKPGRPPSAKRLTAARSKVSFGPRRKSTRCRGRMLTPMPGLDRSAASVGSAARTRLKPRDSRRRINPEANPAFRARGSLKKSRSRGRLRVESKPCATGVCRTARKPCTDEYSLRSQEFQACCACASHFHHRMWRFRSEYGANLQRRRYSSARIDEVSAARPSISSSPNNSSEIERRSVIDGRTREPVSSRRSYHSR